LNPATIAIRTETLTKVFPNGVKAVNALDLEIAAGEVFGFLGPNGAGKTTTVRLLNGTLIPTEGRALVLDQPPASEQARRASGTVTEEAQMYDHLSLVDNLSFFAAMYDLPREQAQTRSTELLKRLGLWSRRQARLGTLSTGMKKRAQLARALLHRPGILFLDEPTGGLDAEGALEVTALIRRLATDERVTVFLCTHNLFLAERICDSFGFLRSGQLLACGRKEELIHSGRQKLQVRITTLRESRVLGYDRPEQIDALVRAVQAEGERIVEVRPLEPTLEEVYLRYVGRRTDELE
jgi:ABC-2 type transport system ATP-binding protein